MRRFFKILRCIGRSGKWRCVSKFRIFYRICLKLLVLLFVWNIVWMWKIWRLLYLFWGSLKVVCISRLVKMCSVILLSIMVFLCISNCLMVRLLCWLIICLLKIMGSYVYLRWLLFIGLKSWKSFIFFVIWKNFCRKLLIGKIMMMMSLISVLVFSLILELMVENFWNNWLYCYSGDFF